jgi:hypothetical protein
MEHSDLNIHPLREILFVLVLVYIVSLAFLGVFLSHWKLEEIDQILSWAGGMVSSWALREIGLSRDRRNGSGGR